MLQFRAVASGGGSSARSPHFTFGPLVAAYIQYSMLKMCPPFWFMAPPVFWSDRAIALCTKLAKIELFVCIVIVA